ncbi:hypothetical protein ABAC460_08225 [Asticcacaulis sp. AC460]|uniref:YciI family protein n=1 Tax=Asticcacaulis sp. AC460 TaxID=1282360 RepID=UPI0003C3EA00|nr:YciI family protein [Asticcacaulis sp. AC460]ESQ90806.1 hypothetical protein ABAC460_08225 [Asticcacaulis sp. AC460]
MHYAILCYDSEEVISAWSKDKDAQVMHDLGAVQERLVAEKKMGPVARLMPTTAAVSLRKGRDTLVLDGPFAETKEQLLGFYTVECDTLDEAIEAAKDLAAASGSAGCFEIRPMMIFIPDRRTP